jgi:hypothetical protein
VAEHLGFSVRSDHIERDADTLNFLTYPGLHRFIISSSAINIYALPYVPTWPRSCAVSIRDITLEPSYECLTGNNNVLGRTNCSFLWSAVIHDVPLATLNLQFTKRTTLFQRSVSTNMTVVACYTVAHSFVCLDINIAVSGIHFTIHCS